MEFKTKQGNVTINNNYIQLKDKKGRLLQAINTNSISRIDIKGKEVTISLTMFFQKPCLFVFKKQEELNSFVNTLLGNEIEDKPLVEEKPAKKVKKEESKNEEVKKEKPVEEEKK